MCVKLLMLKILNNTYALHLLQTERIQGFKREYSPIVGRLPWRASGQAPRGTSSIGATF